MSSWLGFIIVLVLALAYMLMKRSGQVSSKEAVEYLRNGAMLIDVQPERVRIGTYIAGLQYASRPDRRSRSLRGEGQEQGAVATLFHGCAQRAGKKETRRDGIQECIQSRVVRAGGQDRHGTVVPRLLEQENRLARSQVVVHVVSL